MIHSKAPNPNADLNTAVTVAGDVMSSAEGGAMQGAQMGQMAGPEGMAIGAIAGGVIGGVEALAKDMISLFADDSDSKKSKSISI